MSWPTRAALTALAIPVAMLFALCQAPGAQAHYIYYCPGYVYDNIPHDCHANPYSQPSTHQWATRQAVTILDNDGFHRYANLLRSTIAIGHSGVGHTHTNLLVQGVITADTQLNGCHAYGKSIGWPIGDHFTNPYRNFGLWSYNRYENATEHPGWQGFMYVATNGRRTGECKDAPRVRSTSAQMADQFFGRAAQAWRAYQPGDAMFNLGIALHMVQDATVPSHVHPESGIFRGSHDVYPAWASERKEIYTLDRGGFYNPPSAVNGVSIADSPGGWVFWMGARSFPYFPYFPRTTAVPRTYYGCDVTEYPEECTGDSVRLVQMTERVSAGFIRYFFRKVNYAP